MLRLKDTKNSETKTHKLIQSQPKNTGTKTHKHTNTDKPTSLRHPPTHTPTYTHAQTHTNSHAHIHRNRNTETQGNIQTKTI